MFKLFAEGSVFCLPSKTWSLAVRALQFGGTCIKMCIPVEISLCAGCRTQSEVLMSMAARELYGKKGQP